MTAEPQATCVDGIGRRTGVGWLTVVLRSGGVLDRDAVTTLGCSLADVSLTADMVVVDLDAARVTNVSALCAALGAPAARLARPGRCLLLVNVAAEVDAAVREAGLPVATLAATFHPGRASMARRLKSAARRGANSRESCDHGDGRDGVSSRWSLRPRSLAATGRGTDPGERPTHRGCRAARRARPRARGSRRRGQVR